VQYCLQLMADQVTQTSSGVIGGIQAGSVPPGGVVSDPSGQVFELGSATTGTLNTPLSLNLTSGQIDAKWTASGTTITVSGTVRAMESMGAPPSDRFLFVIAQSGTGFYVLTTTNI